jgi:two-component system sensor histidine kinase KdpD
VINKSMEILGATEVALYETGGGIYRSEVPGSISDERLRHVALCGAVDSHVGEELVIMPVTLGNKRFGSIGLRGVCLSIAGLQSLANNVAVGLAQAQAQEAGNRAAAIRKSEELKSVMIDALAHDLKTPLTAIEAASQMLRAAPGISSEQRRDLIDVLREGTGTLRRRLAEAFHLARIDANRLKLEPRPVEAGQLIGAAIQSLGERANSHHIAFDIASDLPPLFADYDLIVQALKQLIDNAVKYSPAGSSILISAAEVGEAVSISVRDHGPGLTELEQSRVFDKFYRGRYDRSAVQGTGMGLSIAKEILEAHGGSIRVESVLGQGSLFTIVLRSASSSAQLQSQIV